MVDSEPKHPETSKQWVSRLNTLMKFLQGEVPEGFSIPKAPKLSARVAESVIWFLQEGTGCIPDHYERCDQCGDYFDSHSEGIYVSDDEMYGHPKKDLGKHFCGACSQNYYHRG